MGVLTNLADATESLATAYVAAEAELVNAGGDDASLASRREQLGVAVAARLASGGAARVVDPAVARALGLTTAIDASGLTDRLTAIGISDAE